MTPTTLSLVGAFFPGRPLTREEYFALDDARSEAVSQMELDQVDMAVEQHGTRGGWRFAVVPRTQANRHLVVFLATTTPIWRDA